MLNSKEADIDKRDNNLMVTRLIHKNDTTWLIGSITLGEHDHTWIAYPDEFYANNAGLIALIGDTEEQVTNYVRNDY